MRKRIAFAGFILCSLFLFARMDIQAAPKTMPDGTVFDADYYASTYPDVAEAVGNDETALYDHYVNFGKAEGRKPTAVDSTASTENTIKTSKTSTKIKQTEKATKDAVTDQSTDVMCWKSATGDKYHSKNNCGKMNPNKAKQITVEEAENLGLAPCKKCWK